MSTSDNLHQVSDPKERIRNAFLQLEFSIRLLEYLKKGEVNLQSFNTPILVDLPEGSFGIHGSIFGDLSKLVVASSNIYSMSVGLCAIALEEACNEAGIRNNPFSQTPKEELRSFVYMLRCAFAHDLMWPKWEARGHYEKVFNLHLGNYHQSVDMTLLNGKELRLEHFGGLPIYLAIRDEVISWL